MNIRFNSVRLLIRCLLLMVCWMTSFGCATAHLPSSASLESRKLDATFESYFEAYLKLFPTFASEIGDHRFDDQLENAIGESHIAAQKDLAAHTLTALDQVDANRIDGERQLSHSLLRYNLKDALEGFKFPQQLLPVRQLARLAVEFPLLASAPVFIHSRPSRITTIS